MDANIKNPQDALKWLGRSIRKEVEFDGEMSNEHAIQLGFIQNMLAKFPRRNCDVGTAEEQHARFVSYCDRCDCPMGCDHRKNFVGILKPECASILTCFIRWAQMPYEEGGVK